MEASQVVANLLPFLLAYVIQFLKIGIKPIARNTLRILLPEGVELGELSVETAIELATHVYSQVSFIFSVLLSTVSALALSLSSERKVAAILAAFVLIVVSAVWVGRWGTLAVQQNSETIRRRAYEMKIAAYGTTTLMMVTTIYARFYPH